MSLENLIKSIEQEALDQSQKILSEAKQKATAILDQTKQLTNNEAEQLKKSLIEKCRAESNRTLAQNSLQMRNEILTKKQEWIKAVFDEALHQLNQIDQTTYVNWVTQKLLEICTTGTEIIQFSSKDKKTFTKKWLNSINSKLKEKGLKGELTMEFVDANFSGGFILKTEKYDIAVTFEEILHDLRQNLQQKVHDLLFEEK